MSKRRGRKTVSVAFTGAAAALTAGVIAAPAAAAGNWLISSANGGYKGPFQAKTSAPLKVLFRDTTAGLSVACAAGELTGSFPASKVPTGGAVKIGTIKTNSVSKCSVGGVTWSVRLRKPASLFVSSLKSQAVRGNLLGVSMSFVPTLGPVGCKGVITGTLPVSDKGGFLRIDRARVATLTVKSATSCGPVRSGDNVWESATYWLKTPGPLSTGIGIASS